MLKKVAKSQKSQSPNFTVTWKVKVISSFMLIIIIIITLLNKIHHLWTSYSLNLYMWATDHLSGVGAVLWRFLDS